MLKNTHIEPATQTVDSGGFIRLVNDAGQIFIEEIPSKNKSRHFFVSLRQPTLHNEPPEKVRTLDDLLDNATVLLRGQEYLLARHLFSAALQRNLRNEEALEGLGVCLLKLGDPLAAVKCFRALWDLYCKPRSAIWLGQCYAAQKEDRLALEWFRKIKVPELLNQADRFEYYRELGNSHSRLGDCVEAEIAYRQALVLQPRSETVWINIATLELQRGQLKAAANYFSKALNLNPEISKAHAGMGIVALQSQDYPLAARFLGKALDLDSQNLLALHQLIECGEHCGIFKELRRRIEKYLERDAHAHQIRFSLAALLYKENEWRQCEMELEKILSEDPTFLNARKLKEELVSRHRSIGA